MILPSLTLWRQLVRFHGLGMFLERPHPPPGESSFFNSSTRRTHHVLPSSAPGMHSRRDLGLPPAEAGTLYLCSKSSQFFSPQFVRALAELLQRDPRCVDVPLTDWECNSKDLPTYTYLGES